VKGTNMMSKTDVGMEGVEVGCLEGDKGGDEGSDVLDVVSDVQEGVCCIVARLCSKHLCILCRIRRTSSATG